MFRRRLCSGLSLRRKCSQDWSWRARCNHLQEYPWYRSTAQWAAWNTSRPSLTLSPEKSNWIPGSCRRRTSENLPCRSLVYALQQLLCDPNSAVRKKKNLECGNDRGMVRTQKTPQTDCSDHCDRRVRGRRRRCSSPLCRIAIAACNPGPQRLPLRTHNCRGPGQTTDRQSPFARRIAAGQPPDLAFHRCRKQESFAKRWSFVTLPMERGRATRWRWQVVLLLYACFHLWG